MVYKENLARLTQAIEENSSYDMEEVNELMLNCTESDIKHSRKQFVQFCHILTESLVKSKRSVSGIIAISNAIVKLQNHTTHLTPIHSDFCYLCLDAKCLNPALEFLEIDYTDIWRTMENNDYDVKRVLSYFYYGGLIYAALKNFERASYFFEVVLTMPANVMSPIMQEAYKKQIIITLLLNGKLPENMLPKYTSSCVLRLKKQVGQSYLKLANDYSSLNFDKIRRLVVNNGAGFERDENMGLIKQCLIQVHKRNIQRLTKTFLTLPLRDVANHVGLTTEKDAELYILNMIEDGEIFARIDQKDGMVVFEDNPEKFDSVMVFQKLQEDMTKTTTLINTLKKLESASTVDHVKILPKMLSSDLS